MQRRRIFTALVPTTLAALAPTAAAHPTDHGGGVDPLHVNDAYEECFFDLHPELTQAEFDEFAKEGSAVMKDEQLGSAEALGRGTIEVHIDYAHTGLDDSKGAWNNTMSHPTDDHYLGHSLAFPRLGVRMGVSRRVDVGVWGTLAPMANYGFLGASSKVTVLEQDEQMPVSLSVRPTVVSLLGPSELVAFDAGMVVAVSRNWKGLSPYAGVGAHLSVAIERTDDVDLDPGNAAHTTAFAGLAYVWKRLRVAGEATAGALTSYSVRVGGSFM